MPTATNTSRLHIDNMRQHITFIQTIHCALLRIFPGFHQGKQTRSRPVNDIIVFPTISSPEPYLLTCKKLGTGIDSK